MHQGKKGVATKWVYQQR